MSVEKNITYTAIFYTFTIILFSSIYNTGTYFYHPVTIIPVYSTAFTQHFIKMDSIKKATPLSNIDKGVVRYWCGWRELNPHGFIHYGLNVARLPFRHNRK